MFVFLIALLHKHASYVKGQGVVLLLRSVFNIYACMGLFLTTFFLLKIVFKKHINRIFNSDVTCENKDV